MMDSFKIHQASAIQEYSSSKRHQWKNCYLYESKRSISTKVSISQPSSKLGPEPIIYPRIAHTRVTIESVRSALMTQAIFKAAGPNKINFQILRMTWEWDKEQMTRMVQQAIRLGYHPQEWKEKKACNILVEKRRKTRFLGWSDHVESVVYLTV